MPNVHHAGYGGPVNSATLVVQLPYEGSTAVSPLVVYIDNSTSGFAWTLFPADTITSSDAVVKAINPAYGDTITSSDALVKSVVAFKTDSINQSDAVAKALVIAKTDTVTLSEALVKAYGMSKSDALTLSDALIKAVGILKLDTTTLSDFTNLPSGTLLRLLAITGVGN